MSSSTPSARSTYDGSRLALVQALPEIARDFGAAEAAVQVTLTAFITTFALTHLIYGPLSDRYGRRTILLVSMAIYVLGSVAVALAPSVGLMTAARVLQAFGAVGGIVLARAVARGAGVDGQLPSPTFNLVFRYSGTVADVVHMDLYRIRQPSELDELGWDELGSAEEILLIEWPERAGDRLPVDRWDIELRVTDALPDLREISVRRVGSPPPLPAFPIALAPDGP